MTVIFLVIAVIGIAMILVVGRQGGLPEAGPDLRPEVDPAHPAFDVVFRGYRMDEVDQVIDALQADNAQLRGKLHTDD